MLNKRSLRRVEINQTLASIAAFSVMEFLPLRSDGDGMESESLDQEINTPSKEVKIEMKSTLLNKPNQPAHGLDFPQNIKRNKPKFVPYEPYKAAVNPILADNEKDKSKWGKTFQSLTETRIPFPLLESSISSLPASSVIRVLRDIPRESPRNPDNYHNEKEQWEDEKYKLEEEVKLLKMEKRDIENQFKVQNQVNCELKKLLVAAMGEDMQTRVQFLSEDKARLAQDIAEYSKMLLDEHEELERLAIQSDIWRSKFLACSLMVDELAGWKALLSRKYEEAKEAIQWMLDERKEVKQNDLITQRHLKQLQKVFDSGTSLSKMRGANTILTVAKTNCQIANGIQLRLLGPISKTNASEPVVPCEEGLTPAEELALRVLATKDVISETLTSSVESTTETRARQHKKICFFHSHAFGNLTMHGCRHCSGEIDVV